MATTDKTLTEVYEEGLTNNVDIFSSMVIPADTCILTKLVKAAILKNGGDLIPIWADYSILKYQIETWSRSNTFIFNHVDGILKAKYSPIENTDKYVERLEEGESQDTTTKNLTNTNNSTETGSGTDTNVKTLNTTERNYKGTTSTETNSGTDTVSTSGTETTTTSGFNSGTYQPDSQKSTTGSEGTTHGHRVVTAETGSDSVTDTGTVTDAMTKGSTITRGGTDTETGTVGNEGTNTLKITEHAHGNIGVSTNTQLINEEVALIKGFSAYDLIAEVFINDMMIGVYNYDF